MYTCKCKCEEVEFTLPFRPSAVSRCHCSICRRLSNSQYMMFTKIPHIHREGKLLQLGGTSNIDLSKISILRSSIFANRGYCKQCITPIYMRYKSSDGIWINTDLFVFDHEFEVVDEFN